MLTWAAASANTSSNARLLKLQTRQAAATLTAAVPSTESKLADALRVATLTKSPTAFRRFVSGMVSSPGGFASVSLWQRTSNGAKLVAVIGAKPLLQLEGGSASFFAREKPIAALDVTGLLRGATPRLGFADWPPGGGTYEVYAESNLPANRRIVVPNSSAFSDLNFALYLGSAQRPSELIEASLPTPVHGAFASASVPFGNTVLTIVGVEKSELTGGISAALWWIVLLAGACLTLSSAATVEYVSRRRRIAAALSAELSELYAEQRSIAETLQHALLPARVPEVPGMEIAVRYLPGTSGVDVGGDWYDVIPLDEGHFVFVVGDVSGRGVAAAAIMASLRHAGRGFAMEGHSPENILEHLSQMLDVALDGHMATVLCGLVDVAGHEVTLANAGHLPPVVCTDSHAEAVGTEVGEPIGVSHRGAIVPSHLHVGPGSTLVAYTDGLIERRGQKLEAGITRLTELAAADCASVEQLLDDILTEFAQDSRSDDIALIGIKWQS